jgi:hypothetical protein
MLAMHAVASAQHNLLIVDLCISSAVEMLRQAAQQRLDGAQPAGAQAAAAAAGTKASSGRSSPSGPRPGTSNATAAAAAAAAAGRECGKSGALESPAAAAAAAFLGANQHRTSKLQQKVLTQEVQVGTFGLAIGCKVSVCFNLDAGIAMSPVHVCAVA